MLGREPAPVYPQYQGSHCIQPDIPAPGTRSYMGPTELLRKGDRKVFVKYLNIEATTLFSPCIHFYTYLYELKIKCHTVERFILSDTLILIVWHAVYKGAYLCWSQNCNPFFTNFNCMFIGQV